MKLPADPRLRVLTSVNSMMLRTIFQIVRRSDMEASVSKEDREIQEHSASSSWF